jgi:ribosome biogenesis GTPase
MTLALNKADLLPAAEVDARLAQVASWGYSGVAVSCQSGLGLDSLAARLAGKVSVVAGPSGAGKSSLINALRLGRHKPDAAAMGGAGDVGGVQWQYDAATTTTSSSSSSSSSSSVQQQEGGAELAASTLAAAAAAAAGAGSSSSTARRGWSESSCDEDAADSSSFLAVGDVSRMGRGRHTTRTVTLIPLPFGGLMADTPGFNQPTLDRVDSSELGGLFPEFVDAAQAAGGCRCGLACGGWCVGRCGEAELLCASCPVNRAALQVHGLHAPGGARVCRDDRRPGAPRALRQVPRRDQGGQLVAVEQWQWGKRGWQ